MTTRLLPQDIYLLTAKWADPDHLSIDESLGPQPWRIRYQWRLEQTIAEWLAKGLIAYQYPQRRIDAFVPISHLVGTSREEVSYVYSLAKIADELKNVRDPHYRAHPKGAFSENDFVLLGECFANSTAKTTQILARRLGEDESQQEQCFHALVDALTLVRAVRPINSIPALYAAWSELHKEKSKDRFDELSRTRPWVIEHGFVLALYPACDIASGNDLESMLNNLSVLTKRGHAPAVLKSDLKACKDMISIGARRAVKIEPAVPQPKQMMSVVSLISLSRQYPQSNVAPRYQYADVGHDHD